MTRDFTPELCQLINYAARVGCAIRQLSAEAVVCKGCTLPGYPDPNGQDVQWLADSIHNLDALCSAIESGDMHKVAQECTWRLSGFKEYRQGFCYGPGKGLKEFPSVCGVKLSDAEAAISAIENKAWAAILDERIDMAFSRLTPNSW